MVTQILRISIINHLDQCYILTIKDLSSHTDNIPNTYNDVIFILAKILKINRKRYPDNRKQKDCFLSKDKCTFAQVIRPE